MAKSKTNPSPEENDDSIKDDAGYLEAGFRLIVEQNNPGFPTAFPNTERNSHGMPFNRKVFLSLIGKLHLLENFKNLPENFLVIIKFSPIVLFKRWIITVTNKPLLKISERGKGFESDFFLINVGGKYKIEKILTNIAHEKFLVTLFERRKLPEITTSFATFFHDDGKLVIYRDYAHDKISTIRIGQKVIPGKLYTVDINVLRDQRSIRYRFSINKGERLGVSLKLGKPLPGGKSDAPHHAPAPSSTAAALPITAEDKKDFKSYEDYQQEVVEIVAKFHNARKSTNKFANISLGRVNKIPILINLAVKFKNIPVRLVLNRNGEVEVFDENDIMIKTFFVSKKPKSNWLEKK